MNTQKPGQGDGPADYTKNRKRPYVKLQIANVNVGNMREQSAGIVEILSHQRNIGIWLYAVCRKLVGRTNWLDKLWKRTAIVSFFGKVIRQHMVIKAKWSESVSSISRVKSCIMMLKIIMEKTLVNVTCAYAPQVGLSN